MKKIMAFLTVILVFGAVIFALIKFRDIAEVYIETEQAPEPQVQAPPVAQTDYIDELLEKHGDLLSVYYENLETGFTYRYNADRLYFSASVPKAFYALYVYLLAEQGLADLDTLHEFTEIDTNWGSGIIQKNYDYGAQFTLRELLRLKISESDNVATLMLVRLFGIASYADFVKESGGNPRLIGDRVMNSELSANEAGLFARKIYEYIESDADFADLFKASLLDNQHSFISSAYPIASKTGWTEPRAWHEMAIVYAPSPFTLVILSEREGWTEQDYADFAEILGVFEGFN
ncbi:MAG: class A beta-lactamase-related serine hydrolase [Defluviitaleaceae bacterium]|nr:class A beta-lactamase-related serine hydrolase [Defluviitaleaceae bacterium]